MSDIKLKEVSQLDEQTDENDDYKEYKDAIKNNQFSEEYNLTFKELKRVQSEECKLAINTILDTLFNNGELIVTEDFQLKLMTYYAFKKIYSSYLNRELTIAESSIVDSAVKILLWKILGKDFNQIVWFRYSHGAKTKERGKIKKQIKESNNPEEIRCLEYYNKTIDANYLPMFQTIPDKRKKPLSITYRTKACHVDYDRVVVDTYDYLDKLIGFRWGDCYYAAFDKFYQETNDNRAHKMANYIRYGTNDEMEIMLLRYGFIFEDFGWLKPIILNINEDEIKFKEDLNLTIEQLDKIRADYTIEPYSWSNWANKADKDGNVVYDSWGHPYGVDLDQPLRAMHFNDVKQCCVDTYEKLLELKPPVLLNTSPSMFRNNTGLIPLVDDDESQGYVLQHYQDKLGNMMEVDKYFPEWKQIINLINRN